MSEMLERGSRTPDPLYDYASRLLDGQSGLSLEKEYRSALSAVTPEETMRVIDALLVNGYPFDTVKAYVGKLINAFSNALKARSGVRPPHGHFLYWMEQENRGVEKVMAQIRALSRQLFSGKRSGNPDTVGQLKACMNALRAHELHYLKKENVLFPYLEQVFPQHRCLSVMWSFHSDFRATHKRLVELLEQPDPDRKALHEALAQLSFVVLPLVFREEYIVFPVAYRALAPQLWERMLEQSMECGWGFGVRPILSSAGEKTTTVPLGTVDLGSGALSPEQLAGMLNALPLDITFVNAADEVAYFSEGKERIFVRSRAVLGRKVQQCHPHESVHVVDRILQAFRANERDVAEFWIQRQGTFIHIRYVAVRDAQGNYLGTLEVSQNVTGIRSLEGNRRLLDWE
jgi:DUF438 domain-containing protein